MTSNRVHDNVLDLSSSRDNSPTNWSEKSLGDKDLSPVSHLRPPHEQTYHNIYIDSQGVRSSVSPQVSPASFAYSEDPCSPPVRALNSAANRERSAAGVVRQLAYTNRADHLHAQLVEKKRLLAISKACVLDAWDKERKGDPDSDTARILVMAECDNYKQRLDEVEMFEDLLERLFPRKADMSPLTIPVSSGVKSSNVGMPDLVLASPPRARDQPAVNITYSSDSSPNNNFTQRPNQVPRKRNYEAVEQWDKTPTLRYFSDINTSAGGRAYESEMYSDRMGHDRETERREYDREGSRDGGGRGGIGPPATTGPGAGDMVKEELRQMMESKYARKTALAVESYISNGMMSRDSTMTSHNTSMMMMATDKDETYYEKRRKNNQAAKRSRDSRRAKEERVAQRVVQLEEENMLLKAQIAAVRAESARLAHLLFEKYPRESSVTHPGTAPAPPPPPPPPAPSSCGADVRILQWVMGGGRGGGVDD